MLSCKNNGRPYSDELFVEIKLESKLKEASTRLELQLAEEQAAKWKAEEQANDLLKLKERSQKKLDEEIHRLLENLENIESQIIQMPKLSIL
ncbi:hypothetical protein V6N13_065833 [Hibiscus sabdariffa]